MSQASRSIQPRNQLWLARKSSGLQRKEVAYLLDHHTVDQVSRYEKGLRQPSLKIILQLEIIYGLPARLLFPEYYEQFKAKILHKISSNPVLEKKLTSFNQEYCFYFELLNKSQLNETEHSLVKQHVINLLHRHAEK